MRDTFDVRGINPAGRLARIRVVAGSRAEARAAAEEAGLDMVLVNPVEEVSPERAQTPGRGEDSGDRKGPPRTSAGRP